MIFKSKAQRDYMHDNQLPSAALAELETPNPGGLPDRAPKPQNKCRVTRAKRRIGVTSRLGRNGGFVHKPEARYSDLLEDTREVGSIFELIVNT